MTVPDPRDDTVDTVGPPGGSDDGPVDTAADAAVDSRRAAMLGLALGVTFTLCAVTGLLSWGASNNASWWPARPAGLYRVTQGTHLIAGVVSVPLLLAKLRTVAPHLIRRPIVTSFAHAVERVSLVPLVGGSIFLLFSGVTNVAYWYPQEFYGVDIGYFFPAAHGKMAIVVVGALFAHVLAKFAVTRASLRRSALDDEPATAVADRRQFLGGVAATAGLVGVAVAGATVSPLRGLGLLSARHPTTGPQGIPVNRTAASVGVRSVAESPDYRLTVERGGAEVASYSLDELLAFDHVEYELPIACVEGWSANARWGGIRMRDLLAAAGIDEPREVDVVSIQEETARGRRYGTSTVSTELAKQDDTLLAMTVNGEPLHIDHGFPVRLIAPNRPGVNQTKWLARVIVT